MMDRLGLGCLMGGRSCRSVLYVGIDLVAIVWVLDYSTMCALQIIWDFCQFGDRTTIIDSFM